MQRKFLCCFPLRIGNVIFGYTIILISIAVVAYHLLELGLCFVARREDDVKNHERFKNFDKLEEIFGKNDSLRQTDDFHLVDLVILSYYLSYVVIGFLLLLFGIALTCGAHKANHCLVSTFFVYSFLHLFFTIELVIFEALSAGWIQLGLILLSDLLLIICLFSVKYLMEAIRAGNIYSRPGHVYNKY